MKQLSIFIENEKGKLAEVTGLLASHGINIRALSIADTEEYGILRIIVDRTEEAHEMLEEAGFLTKINNVVCVELDDKPGCLNNILRALSDAEISIEYTYAFTTSEKNKALMVFRVNDKDKAIDALKSVGIHATL